MGMAKGFKFNVFRFSGHNIRCSKSLFNKSYCGLNHLEDKSITTINNGENKAHRFIITFDDYLMHDAQFNIDPLYKYFMKYKVFIDKQ